MCQASFSQHNVIEIHHGILYTVALPVFWLTSISLYEYIYLNLLIYLPIGEIKVVSISWLS